MKRPPKDLDLPTSRMPGEFYVPPKARDADEIARRRELLPGELVLEQQHKGVRVARGVLAVVTENASLQFALPLINTSGINSAWHVYAEPERSAEAGIRRRRLKYPILKDWQDGAHLLEGIKLSYQSAEDLAAKIVRLHGTESAVYERAKRDFATCVGNAALAGATVVGLGDGPIPGTPLRAQLLAREQGIRLVETRAAVAEQIGSAPTFAQMADRDSDLSLYWRRHAPAEAYQAYNHAQDEVGL